MIDCHIHIAGKDIAARTLEEGDRLGVKLFVGSSLGRVWQQLPNFEEISTANDDMAAVCRQYPDRVKGYCYVNPRHGERALTDYRRRIEDGSLIGLKLWVATLANDPLVFPFIEQSIAYHVPILIHSWRKTIGQLPWETAAEHVADLAKRYPEAKIIMAHLGGQVETAMNIIAPYKNINTDTSGTPIGYGEVALAVERLGADRVLFGSDLNGADLASNIGKIDVADISDEDKYLIFEGNMRRLLEGAKKG